MMDGEGQRGKGDGGTRKATEKPALARQEKLAIGRRYTEGRKENSRVGTSWERRQGTEMLPVSRGVLQPWLSWARAVGMSKTRGAGDEEPQSKRPETTGGIGWQGRRREPRSSSDFPWSLFSVWRRTLAMESLIE